MFWCAAWRRTTPNNRRGRRIIERQLTEESPGFISVVTMVETAWVLDRAYGLPPQEIAAAIERILQIGILVVENEQEIFTAMVALKSGLGSFADSLVAALGAKAACRHTLTFDRKALKLPGFAPA